MNRTNNVLRYQETESGRRTNPSRGEDRMNPYRLHQLIKQVNHSQQPEVFKQLYKDTELLYHVFILEEKNCKELQG